MIIDFKKGIDNKPFIEDVSYETMANSMFAAQYNEALKIIDHYLTICPKTPFKRQSNTRTISDHINNIVSFVGDRGSGKTSCMLSLSSLLLDKDRRTNLVAYNRIQGTHFYSIGLIEPSYFDDEHNILSFFVAKLYQEYSRWQRESGNLQINLQDQEDLLDAFAATQRHLTYMLENEQQRSDDLDRLVVFSAAVDLREDIYNLVQLYKKVLGYDEDSKLLLMVDDIDLNLHDGSRMAELIRKYFVQPNIMVLLSVKMEQLATIKRQEYLDAYRNVLGHNMLAEEDIETMSERYMAKFIPPSRRVVMPDVRSCGDEELQIINYMGQTEEFSTVKEGVCNLIFRKTRYLFYNSNYRTSDIVPSNLRELVQLIGLLVSMPDYKTAQDVAMALYNKALFKRYLFTDWVMNNIRQKQQDGVEDVLQEDQMVLLNSKVVKLLKKEYPEILVVEGGNKIHELRNILSDKNVAYNISVGDVMAVLEMLGRKYVGEYDQKLFFLLKTLYSIRLYEAYDLMTDKIKQGNEDNNAAHQVLQKDSLQGLEEYDKLVGGRMLNTRVIPVITTIDDEGDKHEFSSFILNRKHFKEKAEAYVQNETSVKESLENGEFQFMELMMLCVFRDNSSEETQMESGLENSFRDRTAVVYSKIAQTPQWVADMGSLMFNTTRIEASYKRFPWGTKYWEIAQSHPNSLYNLLVENSKNKKNEIGTYSDSKWKSYSCIRNVEILSRFVALLQQSDIEDIAKKHLQTDPKTGKTDKVSDFYRLAAYFDLASKYEEESYDLDGSEKEDNYYHINFKFYEVYRDLLLNHTDKLTVLLNYLLDTKDKPIPDLPKESVLETRNAV